MRAFTRRGVGCKPMVMGLRQFFVGRLKPRACLFLVLLMLASLAASSGAAGREVANPSNLVRLQGKSLCDAQGPFLGLGISYFQALRHAKFDRARLDRNLSLFARKGFNYVRILSMVSWDGLEIAPVTFTNRAGRAVPAWPDYWEHFRKLLDMAAHHGLRVEVTIFADAQYVMPDRAARLTHLDGVLAHIAGRESSLVHLEVANEAWQNGFPGASGIADLREFTQYLADRTRVLVAITSHDDTSDQGIIDLYRGSAADLATVHFSRDTRTPEGGWLPVRDAYRAGALPDVPPVSSNEPIGPGSSVSSESDPLKLCAAAVFAYLANLPAYVYHSRAGVYGYARCCPPAGGEDRFEDSAGIEAYQHLRKILPPDLASWSRHDGLESSAPFTVYCDGQPNRYWSDPSRSTNGCLRNIGSVKGGNFVSLPMGILSGGVTFEARRPLRFQVFHPLTGVVLSNLTLKAADRFTLLPGPGAYILKGTLLGPENKSSIYLPGSVPTPVTGPIHLRPGPHLFLDERLIESSTNIHRRVNVPARDPSIPNPLVTGKEDGCFQPYMTVLREAPTGRFRLWYGARTADFNAGRSHLGYLESDDGLHWIRPHRILPDPAPIQFGVSILDDGPEYSPRTQRFKYGWYHGNGLRVAASPEGLNWQVLSPEVVLAHNHDINGLFWDPLRERYVATVSSYLTGPSWSGQRRVTQQSTSTNLVNWQAPWFVLTPDDRLDEGQTQFYAMDGYLQRGGLTIGLVKVLRDDLQADSPPDPPEAYGLGYTTLAWSHDGEHWVRDREKFFDRAPQPGAWDHAHAWIDEQLPVGDEVYLYYAGYRRGHKVNRFEERQIGLVKMKQDRYVAREAGSSGGSFITPLVFLHAQAMTLNAEAQAGEVQVQVLTPEGHPYPGFTRRDCEVIRGDVLAAPLRWAQPLSVLEGKPVRLEFILTNARLFAFELETR